MAKSAIKKVAATGGDPVQNPTWYGNIRYMFDADDIAHMQSQGLDLSSYTAVKSSAISIYGQVSVGNMPPRPQGVPNSSPNPNAWSADKVATFLNWISTGYPKGTPPAQATLAMKGLGVTTQQATRIRKEITQLTPTELSNLKTAFSGIMGKDPSDTNSYFVQAGYHWLPNGNLFCQHHVPGYNPWHRAYLLSFENALRSVPGCENVTLPYWDITKPFPDVLKSAPFDKYTLPESIGPAYPKNYVTSRYDYKTIAQNLSDYGVVADITNAMSKTDWEDFHGPWTPDGTNDAIIAAHDGGHVSIGPTMAAQSVAAFDPIFWFFHCNWDRLFWEWQKNMNATDINGLLSTIDQQTDPLSYQIFTNSALEALPPFTSDSLELNTVKIVDSVANLDVDYQDPPTQQLKAFAFAANTKRTAKVAEQFTVNAQRVNVRVQGLNRLKIPGSFSVHLLKDGKKIASKGFFQPDETDKCPTCVKNAIVNFDFKLPLATVSKGDLSVWVEPVDKSFVGDRIPNKLMGNPTVAVHFLLSTE